MCQVWEKWHAITGITFYDPDNKVLPSKNGLSSVQCKYCFSSVIHQPLKAKHIIWGGKSIGNTIGHEIQCKKPLSYFEIGKKVVMID